MERGGSPGLVQWVSDCYFRISDNLNTLTNLNHPYHPDHTDRPDHPFIYNNHTDHPDQKDCSKVQCLGSLALLQCFICSFDIYNWRHFSLNINPPPSINVNVVTPPPPLWPTEMIFSRSDCISSTHPSWHSLNHHFVNIFLLLWILQISAKSCRTEFWTPPLNKPLENVKNH